MSTRRACSAQRLRRGGLSHSEVLATMLCLGLLAALVLPALQVTRSRSSQRSICLNNQSNVARAVLNYLTIRNGQLPSLRGGVLIEDDADANTPPRRAPWSVMLLPMLDHRGLYDQLTTLKPETNRNPRDATSFAQLSRWSIPEFTCDESPQYQQPGRLSYVVNTGYVRDADWDDAQRFVHGPAMTDIDWRNDLPAERRNRFSNADREVSRATGVFLDLKETDPPLQFTEIYDGQSTTILLSENLDAGRWSDTDLQSIGFGLRLQTTNRVPVHFGGSDPHKPLRFSGAYTDQRSAINAHALGRMPRPSSHHPGGVSMSFCDGRTCLVSEQIDPRVYAQLLTPGGSRWGQDLLPVTAPEPLPSAR